MKNISLLENYILELKAENDISLFISNNCSKDDTDESVRKYIQNSKIHIEYFLQTENRGAEKNILFLVGKCESEYFMLLGDDDYLSSPYLGKVLELIREKKNLFCIIPAYIEIDPEGNPIPSAGRDYDAPERFYAKGFDSCMTLSYKAHQISGITLKTDSLHEVYQKRKVHNLYPQVFLTSYSILQGDAYHLTSFPVQVTRAQQENKDWGYGSNGLIQDFFNNYKHLGLSIRQRSDLEMHFLMTQPWRYKMYMPLRLKFLKCICIIVFGANTSPLTALRFCHYMLNSVIHKILKKFAPCPR